MYSQPVGVAGIGIVGGGLALTGSGFATHGSSLAVTGINVAWIIILAITLMGVGIVLTRIVPRRKSKMG